MLLNARLVVDTGIITLGIGVFIDDGDVAIFL